MKAIKIEWRGKTLVIGESEIFELGEQIEEIVSLAELAAMGTNPKLHKLARCYATIVNFAGGNTTPKEIHTEIMDDIKNGENGGQQMIADAVGTMVAILMDGMPEVVEETGKTVKKTNAS